MESVGGRIILLGLLLCSTAIAIETWPWHRNSRLELLTKRHDVTSAVDSHVRAKRNDNQCGFTSAPEVVQIYVPESKTYLQPVWLHSEVILIAASDQSAAFHSKITSPTNLWRLDLATNDRVSLIFDDKSKEIDHAPTIVDTLTRSPADPSMVVLISGDYKHLYVSLDSGNNWYKHQTPSNSFDDAHDMLLSSVDPKRIIITDNTSQLFLSENHGESWSKISGDIYQLDIGYVKSDRIEYLFYTVEDNNGNMWLYKKNPKGDSKLLDKNVFRFLVDGKYLFLSKKNASDSTGMSRSLYVSTNGGESFVPARLPALKWSQSYVLMTTHEVGVFIHVNTNAMAGRGTLYTSDSTGEFYTVSLENHLYASAILNAVHDFYEVQSARGVYITSIKDDDGHVASRISFNRGATWTALTATLCEGGSCGKGNLHLHMNYSHSRSFIFKYPLPLSKETAPHIIMAHGVVGEHLYDKSNPSRMFISDDAGKTWYSPLPPGRYSYAIGDYGNLLYAVQRSVNSTDIWVSHDRGKCFHKFPLDTTGQFVLKGLVGDFMLGSLVGLALGVPSRANSTSEWIVHAVKFSQALDRPCHKTDYHKVAETDCLLGYNRVFNLTKPEAICYNDASYKYKPIGQEPCKCSLSDFECDYGYMRSSPGDKCTKIEGFDMSKHCPEGHNTYQKPSNGLRPIPGSQCTNKGDFITYTNESCKGHDSNLRPPSSPTSEEVTHRGVLGLLIVIIITLITAGLCVIGVMMYKRHPKSVEPVKYTRYSKLPAVDPDEGNPFEDDDEMLK